MGCRAKREGRPNYKETMGDLMDHDGNILTTDEEKVDVVQSRLFIAVQGSARTPPRGPLPHSQ